MRLQETGVVAIKNPINPLSSVLTGKTGMYCRMRLYVGVGFAMVLRS
jgi:hypothetical protein